MSDEPVARKEPELRAWVVRVGTYGFDFCTRTVTTTTRTLFSEEEARAIYRELRAMFGDEK